MPGSPTKSPKEVRVRWYLQVDRYAKAISEVCAIFGISRKTYYKWYRRDHGLTSGKYRARRTHPHTKLTPEIRLAVETAKKKYNYGPEKMRLYLADRYRLPVSATAIYKYYKKRRLIRKPQRKQPWYTPMTKPFVAQKPGENVQIDLKYVPGKQGRWAYQFRAKDSVTRLQYAIDLPDKTARRAVLGFELSCLSFPFAVTGVQTDNGGEFRGDFARYLSQRGTTHRFIPKRSAPWNGKVERANRSVDDEYYLNEHRPWKTLEEYTHWFNHERYHLGWDMHGLTPHQKYLQVIQSVTLEG